MAGTARILRSVEDTSCLDPRLLAEASQRHLSPLLKDEQPLLVAREPLPAGAIAGLVPTQIAYPVRSIFRNQQNFTFQMGEVTGIDFEHRFVRTNGSAIGYDYLILATGATHSYFGHPEWARVAPGTKVLPLDPGEEDFFKVELAVVEQEVLDRPRQLPLAFRPQAGEAALTCCCCIARRSVARR